MVKFVDDDFPTHSLDLIEPELLAHFSFAQSLVSQIPPSSAPPPSYVETFTNFLSSTKGNKPLVVVGESGAGKSSLLANYLLKFYETETTLTEITEIKSPNATSPGKSNPVIPSSPSTPPSNSSPKTRSFSSPPRISSNFSKSSTQMSTSPTRSYLSNRYRKGSPSNSDNQADTSTKNNNATSSTTNTAKTETATKEIVIIPHFIGCSPTSANRYEILRKVILKLQSQLRIMKFVLVNTHI